MPHVRRPLLSCSFTALTALFAARATAQVVPFDPTLYGNLAASWQQYVLSIPAQANPVLDLKGTRALVAQSGPVYYLCGAFTTDAVVREVTMPRGKHLFFPLLNVECSTVEAPPFFGSNAFELANCAGSFFDPTDVLSCSIDGVAVSGLHGYRAQSPLYMFGMPPMNNVLGLPGVSAGLSVTDGYWLLVSPLSVGQHVIHFTSLFSTGVGAGFSQDITYIVHVK